MPIFDLDNFINREKELALVKNKVDRLIEGEPFAPSERVLHFIGPSGMGKSSLLEKLHNDLSNDLLYKTSCVSIFIKLETLKGKQHELVGNFIQTMYSELSKSKIVEPDKSFLRPSQTISQMASVLVRTFKLGFPDKTLVLFLDEINTLQKNELLSIEELILQKLLQDNQKVVIITAGRFPAALNDFALRPTPQNTVALPAFDEKTTSVQVESLKPEAAQLASKIYELGNGVPGNNKKLVEQLAVGFHSVSDELQAIQSLIISLKQEIKEYLHPVIEVIAVLPDFIPEEVITMLSVHPALDKQWDETRIKGIFLELKQIQIGPGGLINWDKGKKSWVMDEPTRALFEQELQMRNPELWRKLHCTAYQMYKNWGEDFNSQLFKDKAVYHQQCLQSAGMDCKDWEG